MIKVYCDLCGTEMAFRGSGRVSEEFQHEGVGYVLRIEIMNTNPADPVGGDICMNCLHSRVAQYLSSDDEP